MSTVCTRGDETCLYVKGAPDSVIARCTRVRREDGSVVPLDDSLRKALVEKVTAMASRPLRCLALATKDVTAWEDVERGGPAAHEAFESDLVLEGVAGCVEIKILRRVPAESSRRPPRHRRDACSMAWRYRFLAARPSQDGLVIAKK